VARAVSGGQADGYIDTMQQRMRAYNTRTDLLLSAKSPGAFDKRHQYTPESVGCFGIARNRERETGSVFRARHDPPATCGVLLAYRDIPTQPVLVHNLIRKRAQGVQVGIHD
jgi:hypothetical protein